MNYKAALFAIIAFMSFAYIVIQPIWNYSETTVTTSILFLLGWCSATIATRYQTE